MTTIGILIVAAIIILFVAFHRSGRGCACLVVFLIFGGVSAFMVYSTVSIGRLPAQDYKNLNNVRPVANGCGFRTIMRKYGGYTDTTTCMELLRTGAGHCIATGDGASIKAEDGYYYLTAPNPQVKASAICFKYPWADY